MTEMINDNIAMIGYFPWAEKAPRADWVASDNGYYVAGTYPQADELYKAQADDYLVNNINLTSNAEVDGWQPFASTESSTTLQAWRAFQTSAYYGSGGAANYHWAASANPTDSAPQYLGLMWKNQQHLVTKVVLSDNVGPTKVKLSGTTNGIDWDDLTDTIDIPTEKVIEISKQQRRLVTGVRLNMYAGTAAIRRMYIYADGVRSPLITKYMSNYQAKPGMSGWCLRVGQKAGASPMSSKIRVTYR